MMRKILLASVAALLLATGAAQATQTWCAVVLKPPPEIANDPEFRGYYLTVREGPGRQFKKVYKSYEMRDQPGKYNRGVVILKEGDVLHVGSEQCWEEGCDTDKREWAHVAGIPRLDSNEITFGWVRRKYIQEFECPEDQRANSEPPKEWPNWLFKDPPAVRVLRP